VADRTLPLDTFIMSIDAVASFPTFGVLFAGAHELYQLVPAVSLLASQRIAEEATGIIEPSSRLRIVHDEINATLESRRMHDASNFFESDADRKLRKLAGEALRHALHIYLVASITGTVVRDSGTRAQMLDHAKEVFLRTTQLAMSRQYVATMLWVSVMMKITYFLSVICAIQTRKPFGFVLRLKSTNTIFHNQI
jgi:hypothetical protein